MTPHLFVYGSLMSTARHPMGMRLAREARLLGPATIQGRLYRVSWYPGVVESANPQHRVHGEAYLLQDPAASLAWLDEYEGIRPGSSRPAEYARVERAVRLGSAKTIPAWVYLYQQAVDPACLIAGGHWRPGRV
jgi:gamma-glutamylcyclotransferase (GGCT)/AIG2-like uncharacterized protein YtfP